jgi:hypothetical protein
VLEDLFPQGYNSWVVRLTVILHNIEPTVDSAWKNNVKPDLVTLFI